MAGTDWDRIQEVFFKAADLPDFQRAAYLSRVCDGDGRLRFEVESLLRADAFGGSAIAAAVESEVGAILEEAGVPTDGAGFDDETSLAGTRMGPYRLVSEIGRGGMGAVYLGERDDDQFRKQVAIKVVKRGMDSREVLARFRHERQILAGLEHAYIARLIDGGTTPDGRPFFVLEHVQGQPIDVYCRERSLSIEDRLRLFLRVCEAVSYAHRSLVVHRDLKPKNIFVDAQGIPKLLDFGVAKLLDPSMDSGLTSTISAGGPLTPEYASPEQILGQPITTAADVYALGAILFELLTESRAQTFTTRTRGEIERVVCKTETPRPSSVARAAHASARLDGDLDNIVLMAMRKDPERRYGSVNRLADDITRYLDGRPVLARQDSVIYRTGKFVLRNRLALTASALVLLSLLGGIVLAERQARRAESARQFAETQRQDAEHERERAQAQEQVAERERERAEAETQVARLEQDRSRRRLAQMLELADSSLFDVHKAIEKLPGATEARRQIVTTTLRFLENLSKDAGQDDRLRFMLSASYFKVANVLGYPLQPNLGDTKGALENYAKAEDLIEPLLAKDPDRAEYVMQQVEIKTNWGTVLWRVGSTPSAVKTAESAVPAAQRLQRLCPLDPQCYIAQADVYSALVDTLVSVDSAAALNYAQLQTQAMERGFEHFPGNRDIQIELGTAYSMQARVLNTRGDRQAAVERYRRAVTLRENALAQNPSDAVTRRSLMITYGNLGGALGNPLYPNLGDTAGAQIYYSKALAIARDLANADPSDQLAQHDLASALLYRSILNPPREDWPESLANLQEADGILQKLVAADPLSVPRLRTLAIVEEFEGRRLDALDKGDQALAMARQSTATADKALARSSSDISVVMQALTSEELTAEILAHQGHRDEALALARRSIERAEGASTSNSELDRHVEGIARAYQTLAGIQASFGNWSDARGAAQRAVDGWKQMIAMGSRRVDNSKVAGAESLLQTCNEHLH